MASLRDNVYARREFPISTRGCAHANILLQAFPHRDVHVPGMLLFVLLDECVQLHIS